MAKRGRKLLRSYELGGGGKHNFAKKSRAKAKGKRNLKKAA